MSMNLQSTSLWTEVQNVIQNGSNPIRFKYTAILHTDNGDVDIVKVISIDTIRDYSKNIGDDERIEFKMGLGDYVYLLYPYRTNLELSVVRQELTETGDGLANTETRVIRYKAIFLKENKTFTGTEYSSADQTSLNSVEIVTVHLQLLNRALEVLRIKTVGGIKPNTTVESAIRSIVFGESTKMLIDGNPSLDGIDIIAPDNTEIKKNLIIPDGTHILSVPTLIQERLGGVYSGGIGTYVQRYKDLNYVFIYPLYKIDREEDYRPKLNFISVMKSKLPASERTYKTDGLITYILGTSNKEYSDDAEIDFMNKGVGFKMVDARAIIKKPVLMDEDGPTASRGQLNTEVIAKDRLDNLNYIPFADNAISSNPFTQYSRVLQRNGGLVNFIWDHGNEDLIYPGIPCVFSYLEGDDMVNLKGVVLYAHVFTKMSGQGMQTESFDTSIHVGIFVEKTTDLQ